MKAALLIPALVLASCADIQNYELDIMEKHCKPFGGIGTVYTNLGGIDLGVTCKNGQYTRFDAIPATRALNDD